ncbi:MAG: hypothetical protein ACPGQL_03070 [Thermoplasmatota archaeon]
MILVLGLLLATLGPANLGSAGHNCDLENRDLDYVCDNYHSPGGMTCIWIKHYVGPDLCWLLHEWFFAIGADLEPTQQIAAGQLD